MPTPVDILAGLTAVAHGALALAIFWHAALAAAIAALISGWTPSGRTAGFLLVSLPVSVSVLAFVYDNPFNGTVFALLAVLLALEARRLDRTPLQRDRGWALRVGAVMLIYGWFYPHFLEDRPMALYAIAAPTGLVPCPTLAVLIGFTLIASRSISRRWAVTAAAFGLFYAAFGMLRLGVMLDAGLLIGAAALGARVASRRPDTPGRRDGQDAT